MEADPVKPEVGKHLGRTLWAKLDADGEPVPAELVDLLDRIRCAEVRTTLPRQRKREAVLYVSPAARSLVSAE